LLHQEHPKGDSTGVNAFSFLLHWGRYAFI
jgi:hypothetical protein